MADATVRKPNIAMQANITIAKISAIRIVAGEDTRSGRLSIYGFSCLY